MLKNINGAAILGWRLGLGPVMNHLPESFSRVMVLTTTGRRSGHLHRTPVNYAQVDQCVYCLVGLRQRADWYRNLQANPAVELWLPEGRRAGRAETVSDSAERLFALRRILPNTGFALTVGLSPQTASDEALSQAADWPVVRIRLGRALYGPGGPGDWVWVWPLAGLALLVLLGLRRRDLIPGNRAINQKHCREDRGETVSKGDPHEREHIDRDR